MIIFVYDGSFEGLLTSIYEAYYSGEKPQRIQRENEFKANLIDTPILIETNNDKFHKVYDAVVRKISKQSLSHIFYAYLSDTDDAGTKIYEYVKLGFNLGSTIDLHLYDSRVQDIHTLHSKVLKETHNMAGFLRFKLIKENMYYAPMEPDHNIAAILAPHFCERLKCQNFIIHDLKREFAIIYNTKEWAAIPLSREKGQEIINGTNDTIYEAMWKEYFVFTDIESRKNIRLQKRLMPQRYWKHLTEFRDGSQVFK